MQPTLSKTSTHASGSQRRRCRRKAGSTAEHAASMAPCPLLPAHRAAAPSVLDSARAAWGWFLAPRHRPGDAERLNARSIDPVRSRPFLPTAPLKNGELPGPRRLPPVGNPRRARADCRRAPRARAFRRPAPLHPSRFRFGLVQPGCFQPQPKAPAPDRRRQPTSATVKEHEHTDAAARTSLQNPLFRRILLLRCERACERHDLRS
jgi:hypothetical protein